MKIESQLLIACKEKIGFFDEVGDNLQEGHSISFYQFLDFSLSSQLAQTFVMYIFWIQLQPMTMVTMVFLVMVVFVINPSWKIKNKREQMKKRKKKNPRKKRYKRKKRKKTKNRPLQRKMKKSAIHFVQAHWIQNHGDGLLLIAVVVFDSMSDQILHNRLG